MNPILQRLSMLVFLSSCFFSTQVTAQVSESDSLALVDLYNATNGPAWNNNSGWLVSGSPVGTWYGVVIDSGRVAQLNLESNLLNGTIPTSIGNLTGLTSLGLWDNQLHGEIPVQIGALTRLTYLGLDFNQLSGTIPVEIGSLTNLTSLWLASNQLEGSIPAEIGMLTNLTELQLYSNLFSGPIPPEIGSLTNLNILDLRSNQLTGGLSAITGLVNLNQLNISSNLLSESLPVEIGNLTNLSILNLSNNQIIGTIPPEIGNLTSLTSLALFLNQLEGTIPVEIGNLSNLQILSLHTNQLSGEIPVEIGNLANLNTLSLRNNQLSGAVPASMATLGNLTTLRLDHNQLTGIPDFSSILNITSLVVSGNKLTFEDLEPNVGISGFEYAWQQNVGEKLFLALKPGDPFNATIPVGGSANTYTWYKNDVVIAGATSDTYSIAEVSINDEGIYRLIVSNSITESTIYSEPIHVSLVAANENDSLTLVNFYNSMGGANWHNNENWLAGKLFTWHGIRLQGGRVVGIELPYNNLVGDLPLDITNLTELEVLSISSNALTGPVPPELANLQKLKTLYLFENQFTGTIPPALGTLPNLVHLALDSNPLTGGIPSELGALSNLEWLDLRNIGLTGGIPKELGNLTSLTGLHLEGNQFTGAIPVELGNLSNLKGLFLSNNRLTGAIPKELGGLVNLTELELANNYLSDTIPVELGMLTKLHRLLLSGNGLTGAVPTEFANLVSLRSLLIDNNSLNVLPDLTVLDSLTEVNITFNNFTFEDIEPNVSVPGLVFDPQRPFGAYAILRPVAGDSVTLDIPVGGSANSYQWYKNGEPIDGAISSSYVISSISAADQADYTLSVTSGVIGMVMTSHVLKLDMLESFFWVGNGGSWKDGNHWSTTSGGVPSGAVPSANDNVTFDAASFTLPGQVVFIPDDGSSFGAAFKTMDWRGVLNNPTLQIRRAAHAEWIYNECYGSLYFDPNMTLDFDAAEFYMYSVEPNYELNTQNLPMGENCWIWFGSQQTANVMSDINHAWLYIDKGSLKLNGHTFIGYNTDYPALWLNGSEQFPTTVDISNSIVDVGRFDMSAFNTLIDDGATITVRRSLNVANQDLNHVRIVGNVVMQNHYGGSNTFQNLEILAGSSFTLKDSTTQTLIDFSMIGNATQRVALRSATPGNTAFINKASGVVDVDYAQIRDITAMGGATFNAHHSIDEGNNNGWTFLSGPVSATDSAALVKLYESTNGSSWNNQAGWLQPNVNVESWYGVTVENGRVVQLNLGGNNLDGTIPSEIGSLTALTMLDLGSNKLTGSIPTEIYNLVNLQTFGLAFNKLEGQIPDALGNLTQVKNIYFDNNQLTGAFPDVFEALTGLETFWIQKNHFEGTFPASFASLANLTMFGIDNNDFTSFPDMSGLGVQSGNISNNRLSFNSLVPNVGSPIALMPQKPLIKPNVHVPLGASTTITIEGNSGAYHQWSKNYNLITGDGLPSISISNAVPADGGIYQVYITHPDISGQLNVAPFDIVVESTEAASESGYTFVKQLGAEAKGSVYYNSGKMAIDGLGNFFILDEGTTNVVKLDPSGNYLLKFNLGNDVAVSDMVGDADGNLFISDEAHQQIWKFKPDGSLDFVVSGQQTYGIAVDPDGNVVMISRGDFKVVRYSNLTGQVLSSTALSGITLSDVYIDIEIDQSGYLYAILPSLGRIDKFDQNGAFLQSIDMTLSGLGTWTGNDISVMSDGTVYHQTWGSYVYAFSSDGTLQFTLGQSEQMNFRGCEVTSNGIYVTAFSFGLMRYSHTGTFLEKLGPQKNAPGEFNEISNITQDKSGNRYMSDFYNGRVQKFNSAGEFISIIGEQGSANDQLETATSVAVDDDGNVYVSDRENDRIQKYDTNGNFIKSIGGTGTADGQFSRPTALGISADGFLFVADANNYRIQKLTLNGDHVLSFGTQGTGAGQIHQLGPIAIERNGTLVVVSIQPYPDPAKVMRFSQSGAFIEEINFLFPYVDNLSSDASGSLYMTAYDRAYKLDKSLAFLTFVGKLGLQEEGEMMGPHAISSNPTGDTVWIGSYRDRLTIFAANFGTITDADSLALVDLFNSTNGNNWTNKTNWLAGPVHTWYGVSVIAGKVRKIELAGNNLNGTLPQSLALLNDLFILDLGENNLTGTIPAEYVGMTVLQDLNLANNQLDGELSVPSQLSALYIQENNLEAITSISPLLNYADLSGNKLTTLPDFSSAPISTLNVAGNKLVFTHLEPLISINNFIYSPQDSVEVPAFLVRELGQSVTFEANVGGSVNSYSWKKNNEVRGDTTSTLTLTNLVLEDDAKYYFHATNSNLPGLELKSRGTELRISSLERDRLALIELYNKTNGAQWTNKTEWLSADVSTWNGVTVENSRVTQVNLANNNLTGVVPADVQVMRSLTVFNVADNKITAIPDFTSLPALTTLDVSANKLDFGSLISNADINGINYANQAKIGKVLDEKIDVGSFFKVKAISGGVGNQYKWRLNGILVSGATDSTYTIQSISRGNMGSYVAEVTNPSVPGLTLTTNDQTVLATANMNGFITVNGGGKATKGKVTLFRVQEGKYDTVAVTSIVNQGFTFEKVVLDDYQLLGYADTLTYENVLPTYYTNKLYWEEADIIQVEQSMVGLNIEAGYILAEPPTGTGIISGYLEEPEDAEGGRTKANKRVKGAGVSVRRTERSGRNKEGDVLISYVFTDDEGYFEMTNLPEGLYTLNIQYPGYPMDTNSDIQLDLGTGLDATVSVVAAVTEDGKINVRKKIVTGLERKKYHLTLYPNPATSVINLEFDNVLSGRAVQLVDLTGKSLMRQQASQKHNVIDVKEIESGLYVLQIVEKGVNVKSMKVSIK